MFTLRFDMRAPQPGAPAADLYDAAVEMCAWSEKRGCSAAVLSEHHASPDGYLPSPLVMAAAIASSTERLPVMVAALLLPFYDVVRLAEDMNVLDVLSRGRVMYVLGIGYRPEEFDHFGVDRSQRGRLAEEKLALLLKLRRGERVEHDGRTIWIRPEPYTPGGPRVLWGGSSVAAARRAGRHGLGMQANANVPGLRAAYAEACMAHGFEPGYVHTPSPEEPSVVFVADDVDAAWRELGPHLLHDARMYAQWNPASPEITFIADVKSVDELRASTGYRIVTVDAAAETVRAGGSLRLSPLCGGVPPEVAWPYLERAANAVAIANRAPTVEARSDHDR